MSAVTKGKAPSHRRTKVGDLLHTAALGIAVIVGLMLWLLPLAIPKLWAGFVAGVVAGPLLLAWLREMTRHHGKQLGFKVTYSPGGAPKPGQKARDEDSDGNPRPKPRRNGGGR